MIGSRFRCGTDVQGDLDSAAIYFLEALDKYMADKTRQIDDLRKLIKRK